MSESRISRLCTICARGGSKGVRNKNLRLLSGKPLIAHSIMQAQSSGLFDYLAVSSDSAEILEIAAEFGADLCIERPPELASDVAPKIPAIRHCALQAEQRTARKFATFVDLDATSPLRTPEDIKRAVYMLEEGGCSNVLTAAPARRSPYFNMFEIDEHGVVKLAKPPGQAIVRRQDAPQCFDANASIYVWRREVLLTSDTLFHPDTKLYVMPEERSLDIDTELDFQMVEFLVQKRLGSENPLKPGEAE